jgi:hypothetical protein
MLGDFKTDLLVWLSSILDHWGALATGGVLVALIQLLREKHPRYFNWSTARRVAAVFLTFAIFQSWQQEYRSRLGREKDLVMSNHVVDMQKQQFAFAAQKIEGRCEAKEGVNETLQHQNRDQQSTINGCLSQAMKLLTPAELKVTPVLMDPVAPNPATTNTQWILLANKTVTPVRMVVSCTADIESVVVSPIGSAFMGGSGKLNSRSWETIIHSPAWSPTLPLQATISYKGKGDMACSFNPR